MPYTICWCSGSKRGRPKEQEVFDAFSRATGAVKANAREDAGARGIDPGYLLTESMWELADAVRDEVVPWIFER